MTTQAPPSKCSYDAPRLLAWELPPACPEHALSMP